MSALVKLNLRCSALPLAFRCPAAIRPSAIPLNESHEAADDGTAVHEVLRPLPTTDRIDWQSIPAIARKYGSDPKEVRVLAAQGVKLWNQVRESFRGALTEVRVEREVAPGFVLTGHADILAIAQRVMRGADWKSGRKDRDHAQQFRGYAALSLLASDDIDEVTWTGLWIREQEIENYHFTRADAHAWLAELVERVVGWDGVYRPGGHCGHCPRNHECDAANALIRRDLAVIADRALVARAEDALDLASMTPSEKLAIFQRADLVAKFAERIRAAIKAHIEEHGDIVADGVRLTTVEENRREVDPAKAWPVLEGRGFDEKDFARIIKISMGEVEAVAAEKAGRGNGASAKREVGAALTAAGALKINTTKKLKEKRA